MPSQKTSIGNFTVSQETGKTPKEKRLPIDRVKDIQVTIKGVKTPQPTSYQYRKSVKGTGYKSIKTADKTLSLPFYRKRISLILEYKAKHLCLLNLYKRKYIKFGQIRFRPFLHN